MNKFMITVATASILVGSGAIAAETQTYDAKVKIEKDADGNYEKKITEKSVDSAGTKTVSEQETDVDVSADGDKETTVTTKTVKDPKGLFNKSTIETKDEIKVDDGKLETNYKKTVDGKVVEEESNHED